MGRRPTGIIPMPPRGWPTEFQDYGRVQFAFTVVQVHAEWWAARVYARCSLFPHGVGDMLSEGLPGTPTYKFVSIDPGLGTGGSFYVEIESVDQCSAGVWIHGSRFDFRDANLKEVGVFTFDAYQSQGIGKRMALNAYLTAERMKLGSITLDAKMDGKWFWAMVGFLPDEGSWQFRLRPFLLLKLASLSGHLDARRVQQVRRLIENGDRYAIRLIAGLRDLVPSSSLTTPDGRTRRISLGKALLAENEVPWYGVVDMADKDTENHLKKFTGGA